MPVRAGDTDLRNRILGVTNKDIGHQIENIVYPELLRRGCTVNIGKSGRGTEVETLITLDDFEGDYDGIQQVNLIDWLCG